MGRNTGSPKLIVIGKPWLCSSAMAASMRTLIDSVNSDRPEVFAEERKTRAINTASDLLEAQVQPRHVVANGRMLDVQACIGQGAAEPLEGIHRDHKEFSNPGGCGHPSNLRQNRCERLAQCGLQL
jgi:hypothetical protein